MTRIRQLGEATIQQRMDGGVVKLSTFSPLQIRKRGVRKVVIRPDGESSSPTASGQFDSPMPNAGSFDPATGVLEQQQELLLAQR